jgi:hypothetical protein
VYDLVGYLKGSNDVRLHLGGNTELRGYGAYSDAGCRAGEPTFGGIRRQSTSGYELQMGHGSTSWRSSKQATVSRSAAEAEYVAAGEACSEASYMLQLSHCSCCSHHVLIDKEAAAYVTEDPLSA